MTTIETQHFFEGVATSITQAADVIEFVFEYTLSLSQHISVCKLAFHNDISGFVLRSKVARITQVAWSSSNNWRMKNTYAHSSSIVGMGEQPGITADPTHAS